MRYGIPNSFHFVTHIIFILLGRSHYKSNAESTWQFHGGDSTQHQKRSLFECSEVFGWAVAEASPGFIICIGGKNHPMMNKLPNGHHQSLVGLSNNQEQRSIYKRYAVGDQHKLRVLTLKLNFWGCPTIYM